MYDPQLGRFHSVDPHTENYFNWTPYNYVANNPVKLIDPDGKDWIMSVNRNDKNEITGITFTATVYIQGEGASEKRATQLSEWSDNNLESQTVNGVEVSFDVNYVYNEGITADKLDSKKGENILSFDSKSSQAEDEGGHVKATALTAGNTGVVHDKGKDNIAVLHESFHFFGFDDRYDKNEHPITLKAYYTDHPGYENDIMGANQETRRNKIFPLVVVDHYNKGHKVMQKQKNNKANVYYGNKRIDNY